MYLLVIAHQLSIVPGIMKSRPFNKKRHITRLKSCEHPWHIGNIHIVQFELDLFRPQQEVVHDCGVLVLDLVVVQLRHVLLAHGVDEERGGEGEEGEEGSGAEDDGGVGVGGVGEQDRLTGKANAAGGEREALDQLDLGREDPVVDLSVRVRGLPVTQPADGTGGGDGELRKSLARPPGSHHLSKLGRGGRPLPAGEPSQHCCHEELK